MAVVTLDKFGNYGVISLNKPPVNSMDLSFWQELQATLDDAENDPAVRAVIYRSTLKKHIFTAGNDIKGLHAPSTNEKEFKVFWHAQNSFLANLTKSKLLTVASIKGTCPAGGCGLVLACDFRFITQEGDMGLNEARIGISVPEYWMRILAHITTPRTAELLCSTGRQPKSPELLKLGMVDGVFPTAQEVEDHAINFVKQTLKETPDTGRIVGKLLYRQQIAQEWGDEDRLAKETAEFWAFLNRKECSDALGAVMKRLGGSKAVSML